MTADNAASVKCVTRLEVELLRLIRDLDGGECLVSILLGTDLDLLADLLAAMKEAAP